MPAIRTGRRLTRSASTNTSIGNFIHSQSAFLYTKSAALGFLVPSSFSSEHTGPGPFNQASDFVVNNPFMVTHQHFTESDMETLVTFLSDHVVSGAEHNSAERDPPPRCHPETRIAIRQRILEWALTLTAGQKQIFWLKGPAGVGKSAIVQSIAESLFESGTPGASFFFWRFDSTKKRNNPRQLFTTIAYQLHRCYPPYSQYLQSELAKDPKLPERAMKIQFSRLIVRPFVEMDIHCGDQPILILIDGIDECKGTREQSEIIQLISSFVTEHPGAPLLWLLSSRPESHLEATFARPDILPSYMEENVVTDSNEATTDVERYLRNEFEEIRVRLQNEGTLSQGESWPTESQILTVAVAARGLFVFAATTMRFIGDEDVWNPERQLKDITKALEDKKVLGGQRNPFAAMDVLYSFILSTIPEEVLPITNKLFGFIVGPDWGEDCKYNVVINLLGITKYDARSALHKLNSVLHEYDGEMLQSFFHKSFADFLLDENRSGPYYISLEDIDEQNTYIIHRIINETLEGGVEMNVNNIRLSFPGRTEDESLVIRVDILKDIFHYLQTEKEYMSDDYFQLTLNFMHACNFSDFLTLNVHPLDLYILITDFREILSDMKELDASIDLVQEQVPLGALRSRNVDISKAALAFNVGFREEVTEFRECDHLYDDMSSDHKSWLDQLEKNQALCGNYHSGMSLFFDIFFEKMSNSPNISLSLLGLGERSVVLFCEELVLIGNRSKRDINEYNVIIPYINDSHL